MSQCYAVPPLERRERPVWQAGLALSASRRRPAARGPNHDATPAALAAGAGRLAGEGAAKRHGPDRVRQAPRAEGAWQSSGDTERSVAALKSRCSHWRHRFLLLYLHEPLGEE